MPRQPALAASEGRMPAVNVRRRGWADPAIGSSPAESLAPGRRSFDQRIVLGFFTAKRLWRALELDVQRHEASFGRPETVVRLRLARKTP